VGNSDENQSLSSVARRHTFRPFPFCTLSAAQQSCDSLSAYSQSCPLSVCGRIFQPQKDENYWLKCTTSHFLNRSLLFTCLTIAYPFTYCLSFCSYNFMHRGILCVRVRLCRCVCCDPVCFNRRKAQASVIRVCVCAGGGGLLYFYLSGDFYLSAHGDS